MLTEKRAEADARENAARHHWRLQASSERRGVARGSVVGPTEASSSPSTEYGVHYWSLCGTWAAPGSGVPCGPQLPWRVPGVGDVPYVDHFP
jgi:hypothetical protein